MELSRPEVRIRLHPRIFRGQLHRDRLSIRRGRQPTEHVAARFGRHSDFEIYLSQTGLGEILGARVLAEFGFDPKRYNDSRARMKPLRDGAGHQDIRGRAGSR